MKKILLVILSLYSGLSTDFSYASINHHISKSIINKVSNKANYQIIKKSLQNMCNNQKVVFFITYPQIKNLKNKKIQTSINSFLSKEFSHQEQKCNEFETDDSYQSDTNFEVKLSSDKLLSIYYSNVGYFKGAAHPNNILKSYNFDLQTGKVIKLEDLFKNKINYKNKLRALIIKKLEKIKDPIPTYFQEKDNYDFYLTKKALVIINLFDNHAIQGIEADINYSEISSFLK